MIIPINFNELNSLLMWAEENIGDDLVYADVVCIK